MSQSPDFLQQGYKRTYPIDLKGNKNQWQGLIKHQSEIDQSLLQIETLQRELRQKTLMSEYDKKLAENYEKKLQELLLQKQEIHETDLKIEEFRSQQDNQKLLKADTQKTLANAYQHEIDKKTDTNLYSKHKEQEVYNSLINRYAQKELQKDLNYQKFYKDINESQLNRIQNHRDQVLLPQQHREKSLLELIERSIEEKRREGLKKEQEKFYEFANGLDDMTKTNFSILNEREQEPYTKAETRKEKDAKRLKEESEYNEFLNLEKERRKIVQQNYKASLENQMNEQKKLKAISFSMSPLEKGLNKLDLKAYKIYDPSLYAMIPGFSPQIGGIPLKQSKNKDIRQLRTEPDEIVENPIPLTLCSPKLANNYREELEKTKREGFGKEGLVAKNYLSQSQLKQMIVYGKGGNIFSLAGQNSIS